MLFLSRYAHYSIQLRAARPLYTPKGDLLAVEPRIKCQFQYGSAPGWAVEHAIKIGFIPTGKAPDANLNPYYSVYDTCTAQDLHGWDDETREWVENRLLTLPGRNGSDYIRLEEPKAAKPWPAYDRLKKPDLIVKTMLDTGIAPELVLAYERENQNRLEVIQAINDTSPAAEPEELIPA